MRRKLLDKDAKPNPLNVAYLDNETLRPWTINPDAERRLNVEISALENTISITSPQMYAGRRGHSVLDNKFPELVAFEKTIHIRAKANPYRTIYDPPEVLLAYGKVSNGSSKRGSQGSASGSAGMGSRLSRPNDRSNYDQQPENNSHRNSPRSPSETDLDIMYITGIQKKMYEDARHKRLMLLRNRPPGIPPIVRYRPSSQPALLQSKMATYLKTKQTVTYDRGDSMNHSLSLPSLYK
ncbi:hypothetical protein EON65_10085 [archaeon]|nr:MAG: hypothetical protein EON65_10085 [archaeon]